MIDLLTQFPKLVQQLLDKVATQESPSETPERKAARMQLVEQLKEAMGMLVNISSQQGDPLTEEQLKLLEQMPKPTTDMVSSLTKLKDFNNPK